MCDPRRQLAHHGTSSYILIVDMTGMVHAHTWTHQQSTIDEKGCAKGCCVVDAEAALVQGREGALYYLTPEGRGACVVSEGIKHVSPYLSMVDHVSP